MWLLLVISMWQTKQVDGIPTKAEILNIFSINNANVKLHCFWNVSPDNRFPEHHQYLQRLSVAHGFQLGYVNLAEVIYLQSRHLYEAREA